MLVVPFPLLLFQYNLRRTFARVPIYDERNRAVIKMFIIEAILKPAGFWNRLTLRGDESDDTVVQPDITVVCGKTKLGKEGCRGAPDFVLEILSPSNTVAEMQRKFKLYRQAGVREYWVLDPESGTLHTRLFEDCRILSRFYGPNEKAPVEILPGLVIVVEDNGRGISGETREKLLDEKSRIKARSDSNGLKNVQDRITLQFGYAYGLYIDVKESKGARLRLEMPL